MNFKFILLLLSIYYTCLTFCTAQTDSLKPEEVSFDTSENNTKEFICSKKKNAYFNSPFELFNGLESGFYIQNIENTFGSKVFMNLSGISSTWRSQPIVYFNNIPLIDTELSNLYFIDNMELSSISMNDNFYSGQLGRSGAISIDLQKTKPDIKKINFSSSVFFFTEPKQRDVFTSSELINIVGQHYPENASIWNKIGTANTNWQDEIYRKTTGTKTNLSFTGNIFSLPYLISYGYQKNNGSVERTSNKNRYTSISISPTFWSGILRISSDLFYSETENKLVPNGVLTEVLFRNPTENVSENGSFPIDTTSGYVNPVAKLQKSKRISNSNNLISNTEVEFYLFKNFSINLKYAEIWSKKKFIESSSLDAPWLTHDSVLAKFSDKKINQKYANVSLNFYKYLDKNFIYASAGALFIDYNYEIKNKNEYYDIVTQNTTSQNLRYNSIFFSGEYCYKDYFKADQTIRRDFNPELSGVNAISLTSVTDLSFNLSKIFFTEFIKQKNKLWLNIRYGITGFYFSNYFYNPNNYHQERLQNLDIGINYKGINDKIIIKVNWYRKIGDYLWGKYEYPLTTKQYLDEVATSKNTGINITSDIKAIKRKNLSLNFLFTFNYNKNIFHLLPFDACGNTKETPYFTYEGYSERYSQFWLYPQVYENNKPVYFVHTNRTTVNKTALPKIISGLSTYCTYKNLTLILSSRANIGNYVFDKLGSKACYIGLNGNTLRNNPIILKELDVTQNLGGTSYFLHNASFLKIDYIALIYYVKRIRTEFQLFCQNAFTFSTYKGIDPEVYQGIDFNQIPKIRIFGIGLNLELNY